MEKGQQRWRRKGRKSISHTYCFNKYPSTVDPHLSGPVIQQFRLSNPTKLGSTVHFINFKVSGKQLTVGAKIITFS